MSTEPRPDGGFELTQDEADAIGRIAETFGKLIEGKTLHELLTPGVYFVASELTMRILRTRMAKQEITQESALTMAAAWGMYLAESRQTHLMKPQKEKMLQ